MVDDLRQMIEDPVDPELFGKARRQFNAGIFRDHGSKVCCVEVVDVRGASVVCVCVGGGSWILCHVDTCACTHDMSGCLVLSRPPRLSVLVTLCLAVAGVHVQAAQGVCA